MGNIIPGTTFVNGQLVTASDLNNQLENATINSDVITPGMLNSTLITGNSELEELDIKDEDFFLVWSSVNNAFRKVRKAFIGSGSGSGGSGTSAFSLSGTTLTMTTGGTGTATFSLAGTTLTITT